MAPDCLRKLHPGAATDTQGKAAAHRSTHVPLLQCQGAMQPVQKKSSPAVAEPIQDVEYNRLSPELVREDMGHLRAISVG